MSIYGPNFTMESMNEIASSEPKTVSLSGLIKREDMGEIIPLINLSNDISFKIFWLGSYYQPFGQFSVEPRQQLLFIDSCFIFTKRIMGRNSSYSVAGKLKNYLSSEAWTSGFRHVF